MAHHNNVLDMDMVDGICKCSKTKLKERREETDEIYVISEANEGHLRICIMRVELVGNTGRREHVSWVKVKDQGFPSPRETIRGSGKGT